MQLHMQCRLHGVLQTSVVSPDIWCRCVLLERCGNRACQGKSATSMRSPCGCVDGNELGNIWEPSCRAGQHMNVLTCTCTSLMLWNALYRWTSAMLTVNPSQLLPHIL
jgi:hypothetical protein